MSKFVYYLLATVAVLAVSGVAYYYIAKVEVVTTQPAATPPQPAAVAPIVVQKPPVYHGDVRKRFQPKLPPP